MPKKMNWDRVRDEEKYRRGAKFAPSAWTVRQLKMQEFVALYDLACFKCKTKTPVGWGKTGKSAYGPWAICFECVAEAKRKRKSEAA